MHWEETVGYIWQCPAADILKQMFRLKRSHISGSGKINCVGSTQSVIVNISGSGQFDSGALKSRDAQVEVSGSGRTEVYASESAKADVSGSGRGNGTRQSC